MNPNLASCKPLRLIFIELDIVENPKLRSWDTEVQIFLRKHHISTKVESIKPGTGEPQAVELTGPSASLWTFVEEFLGGEPSQTYGLRLVA